MTAAGQRPPVGLRARGRRLWTQTAAERHLSTDAALLLEEACRTADRLELLDTAIRGKGIDGLLHLRHMHDSCSDDEKRIVLTVDGLLSETRQQQNNLRQMLATLATTLRPAQAEEPEADAVDEIAARRTARQSATPAQ